MEVSKFQDLPTQILQAHQRINPYIRKTPLEYSPSLTSLGNGSDVFIKLESEQMTGSFKVRGAFNKILLIAGRGPKSRQKGLITASSGNHGLACLAACKKSGIPLKVYCQKNVDSGKRKTLEDRGATVVLYGEDCVDAELEARRVAKHTGVEYISPYNDYDIIAGQGTISVEILEQLPEVDVILVSVGGGGLIGGIARYAKQVKPTIKIVGCSPEKSKVMHESVKAKKLIFEESFDTLSDGTAGSVEDNSVTFELCRDYVDEWMLVTEEQIGKALVYMMQTHHKIVEGSAGVSLGAFMSNPEKFKGQKVVIVSCGSNISVSTLQDLLNKYL
ncbi:L-threonine dehydratase catabolic TdcB-like [Ylistrum balloti]|uniref:L-threonine dehydratase catabolic TdcB-like n=1 Tax=Ylistrum balloti TaxID=509963 RepID=UPI002905DEA7|nr:L-threonine dehydratase catabolic TdcB-like [Ylistrum balloti]